MLDFCEPSVVPKNGSSSAGGGLGKFGELCLSAAEACFIGWIVDIMNECESINKAPQAYKTGVLDG